MNHTEEMDVGESPFMAASSLMRTSWRSIKALATCRWQIVSTKTHLEIFLALKTDFSSLSIL